MKYLVIHTKKKRKLQTFYGSTGWMGGILGRAGNTKNALQAKLPADEVIVKSNPYGGWPTFYIKKNGVIGQYTFHHHQDGKTMLPVKQDIHKSIRHIGGDSANKKLIKGFFNSPF